MLDCRGLWTIPRSLSEKNAGRINVRKINVLEPEEGQQVQCLEILSEEIIFNCFFI